MSETPSAPAAGWYPNPEGEGLRWWDGSGWTDHTHVETPGPPTPADPAPEPAAEPASASSTPAADPASSSGGSAPPPGVVAPSGISTSAGAGSSATRGHAAAGLPAAESSGGTTRILGVRPLVWLVLLLLAAAALLLPFVLFDEDDEVSPSTEPAREAPGKKSSGSDGDGPSLTLLATADAAGAWVIESS